MLRMSPCSYPLLCPLTISDLLTVETAADFYQTMSLLSAHLKKGKIVSTKEFMEVRAMACGLSDQHEACHGLVSTVHVVCTLPLVVESHPTHYNKHLNPPFTLHLTHTNFVSTYVHTIHPFYIHFLAHPSPFSLTFGFSAFHVVLWQSFPPFAPFASHSLAAPRHPLTPYLSPCSCCTSTLMRWTTVTSMPFLPPRTSGSGTRTTLSHLRQSSHLIPVQ